MRLLVTGGSRGIGRAVVSRALADGHAVLAHGRDVGALQEVAALGAEVVEGELTDPAGLEAVGAAADAFGVDGVVASQGVAGDGALVDLTAARIRRIVEVNTASVIRLFDRVRPTLRAAAGTFVVIASQASLRPEKYDSAYCASKWAVLQWVTAIAPVEAGHGVAVRAVCPGRTTTALFDDAMAGFAAASGMSLASYTEMILELIPLRRFATVEETAGAALYLAARAPRPTVLAETGGEVPYSIAG